MLTLIEQINQKLPAASESVLQEVWVILSSAANQGESSNLATKNIRNHNAFLNGYAPEDEGLYDNY